MFVTQEEAQAAAQEQNHFVQQAVRAQRRAAVSLRALQRGCSPEEAERLLPTHEELLAEREELRQQLRAAKQAARTAGYGGFAGANAVSLVAEEEEEEQGGPPTLEELLATQASGRPRCTERCFRPHENEELELCRLPLRPMRRYS